MFGSTLQGRALWRRHLLWRGGIGTLKLALFNQTNYLLITTKLNCLADCERKEHDANEMERASLPLLISSSHLSGEVIPRVVQVPCNNVAKV